jgi:thiol-disulfide isomerase/thioredoxin
MSPAAPLEPFPPLLVACLCAGWCRTCDSYRQTFNDLGREFATQARFVWLDVEDDEEALGRIDVVNFPTLLIAHGLDARFFGPVTPHAQTARQLIQRGLQGNLGHIDDAAIKALLGTLRP